jgi:arabinose-5-phosphate isomerase
MLMNDEELMNEGRRVISEAGQALYKLADRLDKESFIRAINLIMRSEGRIVVTGMGKSGAVGRKIAGTLSSTGAHAFFLHPAEGVHGDLGMLAAGDVALALSYSGETDEITAILPRIRSIKIPIISMTANKNSRLAAASDVVLDVSVDREACPLNLAPTTSTTVMIALGDALAISLMSARGFTSDDYALLHPAGSLGRRLTLKVADVMRTGENVAIVNEKASMMETLFAITHAHAGAAIVVDDQGILAGIITDGDIRRHLLEDPNLLNRSSSTVMNANPGSVPPDILAVEGLKMLDDFHPIPGSKAGEAPVVDQYRRPVGMLMLKDLVEAGIIGE